jgi:hypothetical protein
MNRYDGCMYHAGGGMTCDRQATADPRVPTAWEAFENAPKKTNETDWSKVKTTGRDPSTDADCSAYGCPLGRGCASSGDCASGLSCISSKCAKFNPFNADNSKSIKASAKPDDYERTREAEVAKAKGLLKKEPAKKKTTKKTRKYWD